MIERDMIENDMIEKVKQYVIRKVLI